MKAWLIRSEVSDECVRGHLVFDGHVLATLEPPWRFNVRNVSCVPSGEYELAYLERSASGKYRQVFHLQAVPDRAGILIHAGNVVGHTRGCILVGMSHGNLAGKRAVLQSRHALRVLREAAPTSLNILGGWHA